MKQKLVQCLKKPNYLEIKEHISKLPVGYKKKSQEQLGKFHELTKTRRCPDFQTQLEQCNSEVCTGRWNEEAVSCWSHRHCKEGREDQKAIQSNLDTQCGRSQLPCTRSVKCAVPARLVRRRKADTGLQAREWEASTALSPQTLWVESDVPECLLCMLLISPRKWGCLNWRKKPSAWGASVEERQFFIL